MVTRLKRKFPSAKILMGLGGLHGFQSTMSQLFPWAEAEEDRRMFAKQVKKLVSTYGFHGVDVGLELPQGMLRMNELSC
jgi:GH18 family chitinase